VWAAAVVILLTVRKLAAKWLENAKNEILLANSLTVRISVFSGCNKMT
jgi:hypothetical protein